MDKIIILLLKNPDSATPYRELSKYFKERGAFEESLAFDHLIETRFKSFVDNSSTSAK